MPGILKRARSQRSPNLPSQKRARHDGLVCDTITTETDPRWTDDEEHAAPQGRPRSGPPPDPLARELTKPCHPASDEQLRPDNAYYRCIASSVCSWTLKAWDRNLPRIYKHAGRCRALRNWKPTLFQRAEAILAGMAPGGFTEPGTNLHDQVSPDVFPSSHQLPSVDPFTHFSNIGKMSLQEQLDHTVAALICASGLPARLVDYPEWTRYSRLLNPDYTPPKSNYIRDRLIPAEARRAVLHMREYLQKQVVKEIGPHRVASIVSDDAAPTKKARREASTKYPWILNLADPIHKFNLCIQDICRDPVWEKSLKQLRKLLTHFNMSSYATGRLNNAHKIEGIFRSLQSIGNTRFATVYYAATSVLDNLPALYRIYRNQEIDTKGTPLPPIVAEALNEKSVPALRFQQDLTELVNVIEPFARALLCLESTRSNLSDVYFFWLGALAALDHHFKSENSLLEPHERERLRQIASRRFNEAINDAPTDAYVTAFFLDPRFRNIAIYAASNASSTPAHSTQNAGPKRLSEPIFERIRRQLFTMLKSELEVAEDIPEHPLHFHSEDALVAKDSLCEQLDRYYYADHRFLPQYSTPDQSPLQYWRSQKQFEHMFLLAHLAEKLFSILPNSMCDERAGSRLTHLYSKLRTRLDANSMIEQIQFMQWEALVDGSYLKKQQKKLPAVFQISELPNELIPGHQATVDAAEILPALDNECGDDWLDYGATNPNLDANTTSGQAGSRFEDLIDLTLQELLGLFADYNSSPYFGVSQSWLGSKTTDSDGRRIELDVPQCVI